jgi:hypothetical protein
MSGCPATVAEHLAALLDNPRSKKCSVEMTGLSYQPHSFIVFMAASASACDLYSPIIL